MISIFLLGLSTFCTDDGRIIALNKLGILLLSVSFLLDQVYHTEKWQLGKYLGSILRTLFGAVCKVSRPFEDAVHYCKSLKGEKGNRILLVLAGVWIAVPLSVVILCLLAGADAVFRKMIGAVLSRINLPTILQVILMVAVMFFAVYGVLVCLSEKKISEEVKDARKGEPILAVTVNVILTVFYLVFSLIQILYLFIGKMSLPEGYTYAEYAREGFFQLLAVGVLNLVIVLVSLTCFRESRALKAVLTVMSACTFIMIASSAMRMVIYISYYYLTFLRVFVLWSLAVLFLLFLGVTAGIFSKNFPLFRYSCIAVTCCYLVLSFGHPDYWIARVNIANMNRASVQQAEEQPTDGELSDREQDDFFRSASYRDEAYLSGLCADAAPALDPWISEDAGSSFARYYMSSLERKEKEDSPLRFNVSRYIAFGKLEDWR